MSVVTSSYKIAIVSCWHQIELEWRWKWVNEWVLLRKIEICVMLSFDLSSHVLWRQYCFLVIYCLASQVSVLMCQYDRVETFKSHGTDCKKKCGVKSSHTLLKDERGFVMILRWAQVFMGKQVVLQAQYVDWKDGCSLTANGWKSLATCS